MEDRIVELQQRKSDLARIALGGEPTGGEAETGTDGLQVDDVEFLFGNAREPAAA